MLRILSAAALTAALVSLAACGKDEAPQPSIGGASPAVAPASAAPAGPPAGAPGAAGRPSPTVTLASSDIATVQRGAIEEGIAITGDLHPIETVEVRARIEGDVTGVYVREGQRVTQGQLMARFEASEQESGLRSAEADRVAAESELATAKWNLEQTAELFKAGAVSERDYKSAQQSVVSTQARLAAAQARVRATGSLMRDTRVLAPTAGIVSRRLVESGEHVARGASLFTVVRSEVLELAADVPARQANAVRVGQTVHLQTDGRSFDGKVARVSPTVDPTTRAVKVYMQIANADNSIKGGTFATGRVVSRVASGALVVPTTAVRQSPDDGRPFVYRLAGRTLDVATVQLGIIDERNGRAEVLQGLAEGDRVVVGNVGTLGRGMQVIVAGEERQGTNGTTRPTP
ncbi:MAG TPA: efflux RND transporter periplasmic adaptor subunit [Gemmatimonadaceae bacterium]|nr:efflux RND transporter periplasmic adaptor subunit [Gemmatimonadaceae bacterium]